MGFGYRAASLHKIQTEWREFMLGKHTSNALVSDTQTARAARPSRITLKIIFIEIRLLRRCDINSSIRIQRRQCAECECDEQCGRESGTSMRKPEVVIMKRDNVNAINALCLFAATAAAAAAVVVVVVSHLKNRHNEKSTLTSAARVKTV